MKIKTLVAAFITCAVLHGASLTLDGVGGSTWNTANKGNWTGSVWTAGDDATFGATGVGTVTVDSST